MKTGTHTYAARINGQYIAGGTKDNPETSSRTKDAKKFPDYVSARKYACAMGATDTVSLDRHGLVDVVDTLR
jgi:hypothetical protein